LKYGARVLLSKGGGQPETIDIAGRPTVLMHGGDGAPFVYLHSTLGESVMWLPFYQSWAKQFHVYVPTHPGFGKSAGFENIDSIEDMAFHYVELFDVLGFEQVILGGCSLGGWIAAEFAARWPQRVQCPTLLLWGKEDRLVPPAYAEAYKKHMPHAELQWIKECGHLPMFEREAEFVAAVAKFCRE